MNWVLAILGWLWIILGVWWFFRPTRIRKRFERGFRKRLRWILLVVFVSVAAVVMAAGRQIGGILGTILIVAGIISLIKGLFVLSGKVSDRALDWWGAQPVWVYRLAAAMIFLLGCLMQWFLSLESVG